MILKKFKKRIESFRKEIKILKYYLNKMQIYLKWRNRNPVVDKLSISCKYMQYYKELVDI